MKLSNWFKVTQIASDEADIWNCKSLESRAYVLNLMLFVALSLQWLVFIISFISRLKGQGSYVSYIFMALRMFLKHNRLSIIEHMNEWMNERLYTIIPLLKAIWIIIDLH